MYQIKPNIQEIFTVKLQITCDYYRKKFKKTGYVIQAKFLTKLIPAHTSSLTNFMYQELFYHLIDEFLKICKQENEEVIQIKVNLDQNSLKKPFFDNK